MAFENQDVWRTVSEPSHNGYFMWEVLEVIGEPMKEEFPFFQGTNGKWYLAAVYHFWSEEHMLNAFNFSYEFANQTIYCVP